VKEERELSALVGERPLRQRLSLSPLNSRLLSGTLWSFSGAAASRVFALVASVVTARLLGVEGFGRLGAVQSTIGMFGVFAGFGLGLTATKYVAQLRANEPERAGRIIALSEVVGAVAGTAMTLLLLVLAPWLAVKTLASASVAPLLRLGSGVLLFGSIAGVQTGALSGLEAFRASARVNLLTGLLSFPLTVGLAYAAGVEGAVVALVLSLAINCVLNHYALRAETGRSAIAIAYTGCFREGRILWTFSVPAVLSGLMVGPVYWGCSVLLVNLPNGYAEMGVFSAVNQWFAALQFLPTVLGQAALPMLSQQFSTGDRDRFKKLLTSAIALNAVVIIPVVLIGAVLSPVIMRSYGPGFSGQGLTLIMVLLAAGLLAVQTPVGHVIAASSRMWLGAMMNAGWALTFLGSAAALIHYGALGVASARVIAYTVHGLWTFGFAIYVLRKAHPVQT
jgi:O-antigen/teichoic acid export membrane protein